MDDRRSGGSIERAAVRQDPHRSPGVGAEIDRLIHRIRRHATIDRGPAARTGELGAHPNHSPRGRSSTAPSPSSTQAGRSESGTPWRVRWSRSGSSPWIQRARACSPAGTRTCREPTALAGSRVGAASRGACGRSELRSARSSASLSRRSLVRESTAPPSLERIKTATARAQATTSGAALRRFIGRRSRLRGPSS